MKFKIYWDTVYNLLYFLNISPGRLKTQQNFFTGKKVGTVSKGSNELNLKSAFSIPFSIFITVPSKILIFCKVSDHYENAENVVEAFKMTMNVSLVNTKILELLPNKANLNMITS